MPSYLRWSSMKYCWWQRFSEDFFKPSQCGYINAKAVSVMVQQWTYYPSIPPFYKSASSTHVIPWWLQKRLPRESINWSWLSFNIGDKANWYNVFPIPNIVLILLFFRFSQAAQNILIFNDVVKISGFGQARWISSFSWRHFLWIYKLDTANSKR